MTMTEEEAPGMGLERYNAAAGLAFVDALGAKPGLVSLDLPDPSSLTYERWLEIGKQLCQVGNSWQWWVGDWLNFGEGLFGEDDTAAAVDDKETRYDVARRVTGLDQGYLQNIRWVAAGVAKSRRRPELTFSHHIEVAKLEPDDQSKWLALAIEEKLTTRELHASIREEKQAALGDAPEPPSPDETPTPCERLHAICREMWGLAGTLPDGSWTVPNEVMTKLVAELGEV